MRRSVWILVFALVAGCFSESQDPWEAFVFPTPDAFVAKTAGGTTVELLAPVTIPDANRTGFQAYPLRVTGAKEPNQTLYTWYLDSNLRLVALGKGCEGLVVADCEQYAQWDWKDRGSVSLTGIGWPAMIQKDDFRSLANHRAEPLEWDAQFSNDGTLRLTVDSVPFPNKTYRYTAGQMLAQGPRWFNEFSYERGNPISGADTIVAPAPWPTNRSWEGELFPGEDTDAFGRGFTHRQIAEHAFPAIGNGSAEPCVVSYVMALYQFPNTTLPQLGVLERKRTSITTVWVIEGSQLKWAKVETWHEPGGRNSLWRTGSNTSTVDLGGLTCETVRSAAWPSIDPAQGLEFARSILVHGTSMAWFEHTLYRVQCDVSDCELAGGVSDWRFSFLPKWLEGQVGYYALYDMYFEPHDDLPLKSIVAHPDDPLFPRPE